MKDLFDKIRDEKGPLGRYQDVAEGYYMFPQLEGPLSSRMKFKGKEVICWSINNYLGLGNHPDVRSVDTDATEAWGLAYPMGSRMMSGETKYHIQLEKSLAEFEKKEKAVLVNFGYQGIMSAIDAVLSRRDVAVYDSESHACIIDGLRMHMGRRIAFKHNDIDHLDQCLKQATKLAEKSGGGILVISEGVFGMRGDQGKLKEIIDLKSKYDFRLMVDDAHGFGTLGDTGAGAGEAQGIQKDIDIYFATFAKSMASVGAFLAGDAEIVDYLRYNMRSQIFAKSLSLPVVIGNIKRLEMLRSDKSHKEQLWDNVLKLQSGLKNNGFDIGVTNSCVTPVYMQGSTEEAMNLVYDLRENHGIFCSIVVYPVVPKGMIILRLIPTAVHTDQDIEDSLNAFKAISDKLSSGYYASKLENTMA